MAFQHGGSLPKVIIISGPTASGKTEWSLQLAKKYNGEIISADSRQVYKKMNIGTAKTPGEWQWRANWKGLRHSYFVDNIPHHLIDFVDPGSRFTVAEFRDKAVKYIKLAYQNKTVPLVVGGTGLYIDALVQNLSIPRIAPNKKLRNSLEEKSKEELLQLLKTMDPTAAATIDIHNPRRLIRALEVCILTGSEFSAQKKKGDSMFEFLHIGASVPRDVLYERINKRVDTMVEQGIVKEIELLLKQKYSWDLPSMSGIGYRQFKEFFEEKISLDDAIHLLKRDTRRYARRQLTWFRRNKDIKWCETYEEVEALVDAFLDEKKV